MPDQRLDHKGSAKQRVEVVRRATWPALDGRRHSRARSRNRHRLAEQSFAPAFERHAEGGIGQSLDDLVVGGLSDQLLENAPPGVGVGTDPVAQPVSPFVGIHVEQAPCPLLAFGPDHVLLGSCHRQTSSNNVEAFARYIQSVPAKEATPFSLELDRRVEEGALGTLYEKLPDNQVRCYACAHRCLIKDGLRGICKVRYNRGGTLMVPRGYVGALQCDPIEKKPFFHAFPGTDAVTFGMLGCDLHCSYCLAGDVRVATNAGMRSFTELWDEAGDDPNGDPSRRLPSNGLTATGSDGSQHKVRRVFRHDYDGELVCVAALPLFPIEATPKHPVLVTERPGIDEPRLLSAGGPTP